MAPPRKVKAVIVGLKRYIDNITWYRLKPEFSCRFKPGQFLHLALDPYDPSFNWPESRVFSIANAPGKEFIEVLVSPKGTFTQKMIAELRMGSEVWIKLPFGVFNFDAVVHSNVNLIAGGTGISPFISLLEYLLEKKLSYLSLSLYYGVRNPELVIFDSFLKECSQKIGRFKYHIYCENGIMQNTPLIKKGILPISIIADGTFSMPKAVYYLSGPKIMIQACEKELTKKGISPVNVFYDKWE